MSMQSLSTHGILEAKCREQAERIEEDAATIAAQEREIEELKAEHNRVDELLLDLSEEILGMRMEDSFAEDITLSIGNAYMRQESALTASQARVEALERLVEVQRCAMSYNWWPPELVGIEKAALAAVEVPHD